MSDDFDGHTYNPGRHTPTESGKSAQNSRLHRARHGLLRAASWASKAVAGLRGNSLIAVLRKHLLLTVIVVLLLVPVAALILGYLTRPAPGTASQAAGLNTTSSDSNAGDKKAKPAPGRPLLSASQAPQPSLSSPPPPPVLPDQPRSGLTTVPQRPLAPAPGVSSSVPNSALPPSASGNAAKAPYTPVVYSARHEKHFGESCSGQLTLDSSGLIFKCSDDPHGTVQVALADIESVDSNGIRLISGKKYHFSIAGMAKDSEEQLFANWLHQVR